jgi:hypothetical protein
MPATTPKADTSASTGTTTGGQTTTSKNPTFPLNGIFLQEGSTQTTSNLPLAINFSDSFLVRGEALSTYLKTIPNTTRFCLAGKFAAYNKTLVVSAKAQSYTNFSAGTTEYYLLVEPSQLTSNQNDCLTPNLTSVLTAESPGLAINFDLTTVCSSCTSSATTDALKLYFVNGEAVPNLNFSSLKLTISGSSSTETGTSCIASSACVARGYTCCLQNQCVTDGAVKSGVDILSSGFLTAQEDVKNNPTRFSSYPQYYYVCESTSPSNPDSGGTPTDPNYEAQVRLIEQTQLYNCLNQVQDEYSYCTVKYPSVKAQIKAGYIFTTKNDDINFSHFMPSGFVNKNNITKIYYAGQTLYEEGATLVTPLNTTHIDTISAINDNLSSAQSIKFKTDANVTGPDDNLYISFRVDGTCEQLNSSLARCKKTYIQGLTDTSSTYYHPSGNSFAIPSYADVTTYNLIVKLSEVNAAQDEKWTLNASAKTVNFLQTVQPNQKVEITYYVSGTSNVTGLVGYRKQNQDSVNSMCGCDPVTGKCNLKPKTDANGTTLTGYDCFYPSNSVETPPANQTVYVSSRNMPIRYYDSGGVSYTDSNFSQGAPQEGVAFAYTNNDTLKPNNIDMGSKIGFNEIYGSIVQGSSTSAKPARTVIVKKDTTYDLYTNDGAFSSCTTCGTDYYSALQKIFPQTFNAVGGGYAPDNYTSSRINSTSVYRSDDLLFGRACFLPATMIPWTHKLGTSVVSQRRNRMEAQHFLFANGYQRDWYGFDYGSIIGSFDGVTWFSIGNQRRIKATTNRLYLAVNSYFGDLNVDNSFNITVSEASASTTNNITHDTMTTGAECQKSHYCSNDNDCIRQVGYEYTCQNVAGIYTEWPVFDSLSQETIGTQRKTISSIVGGLNGQNRRCVYRGRGATCHKNLADASNTYNDSGLTGLLSCSSNNYCESVNVGGRFNNRIARFANTVVSQNLLYTTNLSDTFGLGARIIGRPFNFHGQESANSTVISQLSPHSSLQGAICIPGKEIATSTTTHELLSKQTTSRPDSADKNYGIGRVLNSFTASAKFYAACPATDASQNYVQWTQQSLTSTADSLNTHTITQNLSTKHFEITPLVNVGIYNSATVGGQVVGQGYQRNACLRAPGAACFSDLECASSDFIAVKFNNASASELAAILNPKEIAFWKEQLICGNPDFKYLNASLSKNPAFDLKKNKCCRDIGKSMTVGTQIIQGGPLASLTDWSSVSDFYYCDANLPAADQRAIAGYNKPITSYTRYSRAHTIYDQMVCDPTMAAGKLKAPLAQVDNTITVRALDISFILEQYKTLDTLNSKTCCTTHWVRNFDSTFGGGHTWSRDKGQFFNKKIFRSLSWRPMDITSYEDGHAFNPTYRRHEPFECLPGEADFASCEIENFTAAQEKKYLEWFGTFELTGIPQVVIPNHLDPTYGVAKRVRDNINDDSDLNNQMATASETPVDQTIVAATAAIGDYQESGAPQPYFNSIASTTKLQNSNIKKVFSEDQFNCCVPTGIEVPEGTTSEQCCTGYIANIGGPLRCCLPDFTDVSVYLNRYVSSEGRGLSDSAYDPKTGYIKDPATVLQKAANVCCSGKAAYGVAISTLHIPLTDGTVDESAPKTRRFVYRDDSVDNNAATNSIGSRFEAGLKWNNHVYCVPTTYNAE